MNHTRKGAAARDARRASAAKRRLAYAELTHAQRIHRAKSAPGESKRELTRLGAGIA